LGFNFLVRFLGHEKLLANCKWGCLAPDEKCGVPPV
jgi:hypothetical protein